MATLLRKAFDYTGSASAILSSASGYEYHIIGLELDNNTGDCYSDTVRFQFVYIIGNENIYGVYNGNAFNLSIAANRSWKMSTDVPYAVIPEGSSLYYWPRLNTKRSSGVLYYYKVSTATGTNMQINIGDSFKVVAGMQINVSDVWKDVTAVKINVGDSWKTVF